MELSTRLEILIKQSKYKILILPNNQQQPHNPNQTLLRRAYLYRHTLRR